MSYDLMVFEKKKAPQNKKDFMKWYDNQTKWEENHDYETISVTSPELQNWFLEMKDTFPPMNGEYAPDDDALDNEDIESRLADYSIGYDVIYVAFGWSVSEEAYEKTLELAKKYDVGFFDVSGDGSIIMPDGMKME